MNWQNTLTLEHAKLSREARQLPADSLPRLTGIPLHGRDYVMVQTGEPCPSCHGDGKHKTAVPSRCGVCCGGGRAYERKALTPLGEQLIGGGL